MKLNTLTAENYRNLSALEYTPGGGVNIICGANGMGKTNIIEGIWLFTGCRSFRSVHDREVVKLGCDRARLKMEFFSGSRNKQAEMLIDEKRHFTLNGIALPSGRKMMGEFTCVVFTPLHLAIVKNGPDERRRFLDIAISQLRPNYAKTILEYSRVLVQRNAALRAAKDSPAMAATLDLWDGQLAAKGAVIIDTRMKYLARLTVGAQTIYDEISSGRETLELKYKEFAREKADTAADIKKSLLAALEQKRAADLERCVTSVGPHREEFSVKLSGVSARTYGSQGQQRSAALALKLAEARLINEVTGEEPVVLLDDVFSELDPQRQQYVVRHFENRQVFITCCDEAGITRLTDSDVTVHSIEKLLAGN